MIQQKCLLRNGSVVASRRQGGGNGLAASLKTETVSGGAVARRRGPGTAMIGRNHVHAACRRSRGARTRDRQACQCGLRSVGFTDRSQTQETENP